MKLQMKREAGEAEPQSKRQKGPTRSFKKPRLGVNILLLLFSARLIDLARGYANALKCLRWKTLAVGCDHLTGDIPDNGARRKENLGDTHLKLAQPSPS